MAQLEQCVVVSARVVGLSRLLRRSPEAQAPRAMALIREIFAGLQGVDVSLQVESRLLLWSKLEEDGRPQAHMEAISGLLSQVALGQMKLAHRGFFLSGAVTLGKVLWDVERGHRDLTGPGLRRARQLARRNIDPCLVVSPSIFALGTALGPIEKARSPSPMVLWRHIQPDGWGRFFLDYLGWNVRLGEQDHHPLFRELLDLHRSKLEEQIEQRDAGDGVPPWLLWLCHYHNRVVRRLAKREGLRSAAPGIVSLPPSVRGLELPPDLRLIND